MAGRVGVKLAEYRALEAGELRIDYDLCVRITELCGGLARRLACQTWAMSRLVTVRRGRRWG